jgi:pyruvate ferredoxin oxidoreductase alpha subunit
VEVPDQAAVDAFLPAFEPRQVLDPAAPVTIGAMVGPEAFTEVRYLSELQLVHARSDFTELAEEFAEHIGRPLEPVSGHRLDGAGTVIVCLGSVTGTLRMLSDELAGTEDGFGVLTVNMFRPFPYEEVREALAGAQRVIVLERAFAPGSCGIMSQDVRYALSRTPAGALYTVVAGLGGRSIRRESLRQLLIDARSGLLEDLSFLDLRTEVVTQELARSREQANPGPSTLSLLRASAAPASGMH